MVIESAHRLIAVSLGKIASSRNQRGGVRLHRSLLVAGVLMNARTASSVYHDADDTDYSDEHDIAIELHDVDSVEGAEIDATMLTPLLPPPTATEPQGTEPLLSTDDISKPVLQAAAAESALQLADMTTSATVEPVRQQDTVSRISGDVTTVAKCERKRKRLGHDDDEVNDDSVEIKRTRFIPESPKVTSCSQLVADSLPDAVTDDMEVDSVQLSSLVHCFNSGFQGLLSNSNTVECSSSFTYSLDTSDSLHHTATSDSIISCSIHIREALETLSRPVLAMSV